MTPRPQPTPPPPPPVNLVPIESGLARLQVQHRELQDQVVEQNASLKKVEDQLQHVREATDRNTLEQQELMEDLKAVGTKVNIFAYIALALLGLSVVLNIVLFVQLRHILR
jgi:predicted ATP-grasp superfamily ATP-dependent carboligase